MLPGIDVVNVEGTSITNTLVPTGSDVINSCASNSVTGQTVCTANNNDVYILKGTGLDPSVSSNPPLTDGGSGTISFSGGSATTTGVSMDATDNKALIALSVGGVDGLAFLRVGSGRDLHPDPVPGRETMRGRPQAVQVMGPYRVRRRRRCG